MTLKIIGTGVGRTGTHSLKLALTALNCGPCYHMDEVLPRLPTALPLWQAAAQGNPDFGALYDGYQSAVDWPTAGFFRELVAAYPNAKFIHTVRSAESWASSFSETIQRLIAGKEHAPEALRPLLQMSQRVVEKTGFSIEATPERLARDFVAHTEAVRAVIPEKQLLIFEVEDGWEPLCEFLDLPVPDTAYPRTNNRADFWERIQGAA